MKRIPTAVLIAMQYGIIYTTMKQNIKIVIDTNVLVAALRSKQGQSFALLQQIGIGEFTVVLSVPLLMEYQDVLSRAGMVPISSQAVNDILDYLCAECEQTKIHFLWRPLLLDIKDDLVLEAALSAQCHYIVTWNVRDFAPIGCFGLSAITPKEFLSLIKRQQK